MAQSLAGSHPFHPTCRPVAFIDDFRGGLGQSLGEAPIVSFDQWREGLAEIPCIVAVGNPV